MSKCRWVLGAIACAVCFGASAEEALTSDRVTQIEYTLYGMGYHCDTFDGTVDKETCAALRNFQIANGLKVTGAADAETLHLLESGTGVTCHDYLVSTAHNYADMPILQRGSGGPSVAAIQRRLKDLGYFTNSCDGVFGEATGAAVRRFQMANGLHPTGVADRSTQMRLNMGTPLSWQTFLELSTSVYGDVGSHVRQMQFELQKMGYFSGECTGNFGEQTREALRQFQLSNNLEQTGNADAETCSKLYSGSASALVDPLTLNLGDYSNRVAQLQGQLETYGYYNCNITGIFGATTATSVRLFQIANRLPATGAADVDTQQLLASGQAVRLDSVRDQLREQVRNQDSGAGAVVGKVAMDLRGQAFKADDEDLYNGFAFVQFVCASAGIPVVAPEDVIGLISEPVKNFDDVLRGDILAFKNSDGSCAMMAIGAGGGRAIYATSTDEWVLESKLDNLEGGELYRWNMNSAEE